MKRKHSISLLIFITSLPLWLGCSSLNPNEAEFSLHWKGGKEDSCVLYLRLQDSVGRKYEKDFLLSNKKGEEVWKLALRTPLQGYLYPSSHEWFIPIKIEKQHTVALHLDLQSPHSYIYEGDKDYILRNQVVEKELKKIQEWDRMLYFSNEGEIKRDKARQLINEIRQTVAQTIVENKEDKGSLLLADEFFSGFEGAKVFDSFYPKEELPSLLVRLDSYRKILQNKSDVRKDIILNFFPFKNKKRKKNYLWILLDRPFTSQEQDFWYNHLKNQKNLMLLAQFKNSSDTISIKGLYTPKKKGISRKEVRVSKKRVHSIVVPSNYFYEIQEQMHIDSYPYYIQVDSSNRVGYHGKEREKSLYFQDQLDDIFLCL